MRSVQSVLGRKAYPIPVHLQFMRALCTIDTTVFVQSVIIFIIFL